MKEAFVTFQPTGQTGFTDTGTLGSQSAHKLQTDAVTLAGHLNRCDCVCFIGTERFTCIC